MREAALCKETNAQLQTEHDQSVSQQKGRVCECNVENMIMLNSVIEERL